MIKNILRSPLCGVLAVVFLIAVLVQGTTPYQSIEAQPSLSRRESGIDDPLSNAVKAIGGLKTVQDVKTLLIMAEGNRFEPGQKFEPIEQPLPVSDFSYDLAQNLSSDELRMNWHRDVVYPYPNKLDYSVVIANNTGYTYGKDGLFSPERAPMRHSEINAILKDQLISSPLLLLQTAVKNPDIVQVQADQKFQGSRHHVITLTPKENMPPIRIFFDNSTFLPSKVETIEDDPIHGDVLIEVFFDDWREVDGGMFPFLVTHELHDEVIEERRSLVDVNVILSNDAFTVPPNIQNLSEDVEEDSSRGWLASQWYLRMHAFGIAHYDINHLANFTEMMPGVYHVTGSTHHSLVVEMNDHIVVVEPPLYEERSQAVIDEIAKRWPDKPIRYIVATHAHDDHIGGLRAYADKGATIISSEAALPEVEHILNSSHTIRPDSFQMSHPEQVKIETVSSDKKMTLSDGNKSIEIYPLNNTHSNGMLAVYLPPEKVLLTSDLYSPGGTPEPFRKYSKELLEFITDSGIDVDMIAGTHGKAGGDHLKTCLTL
jgi:glyoxylase-like metal-dependent hydrolase (beta-lactamase superfamily II)/outer membrane lipoprotein-sorting protein